MKRFGLIGFPLQNSFSKTYFNEKFLSLDLKEYSYDNFPIANIHEFPELVKNTKYLTGLNVTIPHKQQIIPYLDELDTSASETGAVNTIRFVENKLKGYNTDIYGFERSLLPLLKPWHQKALVLGTGGASKAVCFVLKKLGIDYLMVSRDPSKGITYAELDKPAIRAHQLIVNCTPMGMYPNVDSFPELPYEFITNKHFAYDLVYLPEETLFLKKAAEMEAQTKGGLEMLHLQAEAAWRIWNND